MIELIYLVGMKDDPILQPDCISFLYYHFDNLLGNKFSWNAVRVFTIICSLKTANGDLTTYHRLIDMYQETMYSLGSTADLMAENEDGLDRRDLLLCALVAMGEALKLYRSMKLEKYASLTDRLSRDIACVLKTLFKDLPDPKPRGFYQQLLNGTTNSQGRLNDEASDTEGGNHIRFSSFACPIHDTTFKSQTKPVRKVSNRQRSYSTFAAHVRPQFYGLDGVSSIASIDDSSRTKSDRLSAQACSLVQDLEDLSLARKLDVSKIIRIRCSSLKGSSSKFTMGPTEQHFAEASACEADTIEKIRELPRLEEEYIEKSCTLKSSRLLAIQSFSALLLARFESFSHEETVEWVRSYLEAIEELRSLKQTYTQGIDFVERLRAEYENTEHNSRPGRRNCYFTISAIQRMIDQCSQQEERLVEILAIVSVV